MSALPENAAHDQWLDSSHITRVESFTLCQASSIRHEGPALSVAVVTFNQTAASSGLLICHWMAPPLCVAIPRRGEGWVSIRPQFPNKLSCLVGKVTNFKIISRRSQWSQLPIISGYLVEGLIELQHCTSQSFSLSPSSISHLFNRARCDVQDGATFDHLDRRCPPVLRLPRPLCSCNRPYRCAVLGHACNCSVCLQRTSLVRDRRPGHVYPQL